jgi:hypothetical protein
MAEIKKLDLVNHSLIKRIEELEKKQQLGGLVLSKENQRKLEYLLKQVISYK